MVNIRVLFSGLLPHSFLLLMTTAWHGAEVVYRYGVGVMSLPKSTGDGHQHGKNNKSAPGSHQRKKSKNHSGCQH